jgi:hypothetical protein
VTRYERHDRRRARRLLTRAYVIAAGHLCGRKGFPPLRTCNLYDHARRWAEGRLTELETRTATET